MRPSLPKIAINLFIVTWLALIIGGFIWINRPIPDKPPPAGWKIWKEAGPVKSLVLLNNGVMAGGTHGLFHKTKQGDLNQIKIPSIPYPVMINALLMNDDSILFVAHDQGLSIRNNNHWETLTQDNGLPGNMALALTKTKNEEIWLGTNKGALKFSYYDHKILKIVTILTSKEGLLHDFVNVILEDADSGIWFGNYAAPEGGVSRLKDGAWQYWTIKDNLPHPNITSLMLDKKGRIWAGCGLLNRGGAAVFSNTVGQWRLETTIPVEQLAGPKVRSLYQDSRDLIWMGSEYDGMTVMHEDKPLRIITIDDGLAGQEVMSIAEADDGSMWLGTINGLNHIDHQALYTLIPQLVNIQ